MTQTHLLPRSSLRHYVLGLPCALALGLCLASGAQAAPSAPVSAQSVAPMVSAVAGRSVAYTAVRGDSLYRLVRAYCTGIDAVAILQRLNRIANPHRIPVGQIIMIPMDLLRAEALSAQLVAVRGDVVLSQGNQRQPARPGVALGRGWTLTTGANGFATIELPNGSRTSLPTRSRLTIRQLRRFVLRQIIDYDLEVGDGKAETQVTPIPAGKGEFRIRTPRAVSAVRGTQFRVGYGEGMSSTEVLDGKVAIGYGSEPNDAVSKGFGACIGDSGKVSKEALLPAPDVLRAGRVQSDPLVTLALRPVAGAVRYKVQIGEDAALIATFAETVGAEPKAVFADIPDGAWFARVTAISASGLEGMSQTYALRRALAAVDASVEADGPRLRFRWSGAGAGTRLYRFQIAAHAPETAPIIDELDVGPQGLDIGNLEPGTYFWRVGLTLLGSDGRVENWTPYSRLTVAPPEK